MAQHTTETRIALIERRQDDNEKLIEKLSQAITAIQDLAQSLNQVIKIHEVKIDHRIDAERELYDTMQEYQEKLERRIVSVEQETEEVAKRLEAKIDVLKGEMTAVIKESMTPVSTEVTKMQTELGRYKHWLWFVGGAAIVAALFIPGAPELISALL